ncbi:WD-40 repeat-containing protein [Cavenderia fasciculata]|uniref:WD-40 repeat-containing protein n=1 Tax=Cavenderia fasciculata TaxID=261658 RepID=F4PXL6_CACFS|nr:WD-40 repeat-containing protein [Cavenderia fasciculata]EGG19526.1 WD-40 repeat-containing protein [Cavenderia fasciculata]|eukprot:XP_004357820.1 WD-40 repeat-containing protein [Cavenderia fasciculata]
MNLSFQDPFRIGDIPEGVEDYLMDSLGSKANCLKFNRRGTLLAVGNQSGTISIWDFITKSIVRLFASHKQSINSLSWTRDGQRLLSGSSDGSIILWDINNSSIIYKLDFDSSISCAQLHPRNGDICLVSLQSSPPLLIHLPTNNMTPINVMGDLELNSTSPPLQQQSNNNNNTSSSNTSTSTTSTTNQTDQQTSTNEIIASYSWKGDHIVVGDSKGNLLFYNSTTQHKKNYQQDSTRSSTKLPLERVVKVSSGSAAIKEIEFSRDGKYMLVNATDKVIRLYSLEAFAVVREYHDSVNRAQWKKCCFSNNSEYLVAGMQHKSMHSIFCWSVSGGLVKDLEGPKEGFQFICWHPLRPMLLTISLTGIIYIWSTIYTDTWSAFAPDFTELEENEEYRELEDEFDAKDSDDESTATTTTDQTTTGNGIIGGKGGGGSRSARQRQQIIEQDDVDIETIAPIPEFSSDEEEEINSYCVHNTLKVVYGLTRGRVSMICFENN